MAANVIKFEGKYKCETCGDKLDHMSSTCTCRYAEIVESNRKFRNFVFFTGMGFTLFLAFLFRFGNEISSFFDRLNSIFTSQPTYLMVIESGLVVFGGIYIFIYFIDRQDHKEFLARRGE